MAPNKRMVLQWNCQGLKSKRDEPGQVTNPVVLQPNPVVNQPIALEDHPSPATVTTTDGWSQTSPEPDNVVDAQTQTDELTP